MPATIEVPVLIVGAGPVGLTAARLLEATGRPSLVVERRDGPQRNPAAHVVNARTLEIFRQAGVDMAAIDRIAIDPADGGHVNFLTRLGGDLIGRLTFERQGPEIEALTPNPLRNISQHRLEPLLASEVDHGELSELRYRTEWTASEQDDDGVTSTIRDLDTGETLVVRSRYLLAADGAGSRVRRSLGIEMVGPPNLQSYVNIHLAADFRSIVADRPGVLHFVLDPAANGAFVAHDIDREWVYMRSYDPTEETIDDFDDARCRALVGTALGDVDADFDVLGVGTWHMSAQVSPTMRDGRIFLVGDAAHRFPPTGGLGLNTGVADVQNLVWKLIAVDDGWADASLLDSYHDERHRIAGINCHQSLSNAVKMVAIAEALGVTKSPTTDTMLAALADPARRPAIDAAIDEQATHFDMIGLQLGYSYGESTPSEDDPRVFEPTGGVGTRLPHAWLGDERSTLDLVAPDRFTLISTGDHEHWSHVATDRAEPTAHAGVDDDAWRTVCRLEPGDALLVRPDHHIAGRLTNL